MNPELTFNFGPLSDALDMLPPRMDTPAARVLLLATALQESRLIHRRQLVGNPPRPTGPAKGFFQMEQGGGVLGVLRHRASRDMMLGICKAKDIPPTSRAVWDAIENDDVLACYSARLLYWTDSRPIPDVGDADSMWDYYMRVWRPGKPHHQTWNDLHWRAMKAVLGADA